MSSNNDTVTPSHASEHLTGRVKWFNNKAGYGFINVTDGARSGTDVFVHHSAINVDSQQYKYLVQGEYVEFDLNRVESDKHEWQASQVAGIRCGKLMCETRRDFKMSRNEYRESKNANEQANSDEPQIPRQKGGQRKTTGSRGRVSDSNRKEWTLVGDRPRTQTRNPANVKRTDDSSIITIQSK
jgi:cold shock protein